MNLVMPFAQKMLAKRHAFYPFGATMSPAGQMSYTASDTGQEQPKPQELIDMLEQGFRDGARAARYKATALVVDARTVPPGRKEKRDCIEVRLDHRDHYSVRVLFPYTFSSGGDPILDPPFVLPGEHKIFSP